MMQPMFLVSSSASVQGAFDQEETDFFIFDNRSRLFPSSSYLDPEPLNLGRYNAWDLYLREIYLYRCSDNHTAEQEVNI